MNNKYNKEVNYTARWRAEKHPADKRKKESEECGFRVGGGRLQFQMQWL